MSEQDPAPSAGSAYAPAVAPPLHVALSGSDPDAAIASLAGMYAGKSWYSTAQDADYWYHYVGVGDQQVSFRRSQMHGYLRGDVAVEGEFVVQWITDGAARVDVGRDEVRLTPGTPTLFPVDRRFAMEYQSWDQRLVHLSRDLVIDVAGEHWNLDRPVRFDHTVSPDPAAVAVWQSTLTTAYRVLQRAGAGSLLWHQAQRDLARAFLQLYPPHLDPLPPAVLGLHNTKVRTMVEYLHAHAHEPITVTMLAGTVGLSVRAVQQAFQRTLEISPMAYLQQIRLERVRDALLTATPGTIAVGDIARAWGFTHMGRFAGTYAHHFGEYPSDTLRRHRTPIHPTPR